MGFFPVYSILFLHKMRLITLIMILLFTKVSIGQIVIEGMYSDRFGEKIELKSDSTFVHTYRFDLASSWTIGKWRTSNDTIYLVTQIVKDTLQIRDAEGRKVKDSLVISSDKKSSRIENGEYIIDLISSGGQNRVKPPEKLFRKRGRLYRFREGGSLDVRRLKAFWINKRYRTYFEKRS